LKNVTLKSGSKVTQGHRNLHATDPPAMTSINVT